jgi:hypothetical protein
LADEIKVERVTVSRELLGHFEKARNSMVDSDRL